MDGGCEGPDWVHYGVIVVVVRDRDILFFVLLLLKSPSHLFGVEEIWVVVGELAIANEEVDVFELTELCFPFARGFEIFARAAGPKESGDCKDA